MREGAAGRWPGQVQPLTVQWECQPPACQECICANSVSLSQTSEIFSIIFVQPQKEALNNTCLKKKVF